VYLLYMMSYKTVLSSWILSSLSTNAEI
jgi:hypothetical protein